MKMGIDHPDAGKYDVLYYGNKIWAQHADEDEGCAEALLTDTDGNIITYPEELGGEPVRFTLHGDVKLKKKPRQPDDDSSSSGYVSDKDDDE